MTPTLTNLFPMELAPRWNVFFAEDSDRDLDFDEGFEEDELHQSKPPSRRPLLWILLLVLVAGVAYWTLNNQGSNMTRTTVMDSAEETYADTSMDVQAEVASPLFGENETVVLSQTTGEAMLTKEPTNSEPGPMVKADETLTILDGSHETTGWIYQVKTVSGKKGWISEEKLRPHL